MKTLIVYSTNSCAEKVAAEMKEHLDGKVTAVNLNEEQVADLKGFDRVILGGSIHAGQIQKKVKEFCLLNLKELKYKELGLFICCTGEGEKAWKQFNEVFPEELIRLAKSTAIFGGEDSFQKMNFSQKMIDNKVAPVTQSNSMIDRAAIRKFSRRMDRIFNPFLFLA